MGPQLKAFVQAVRELRELGATNVRFGDFSVTLSPPSPEIAPTAQLARVDLTSTDLAELRELREMKRRADELGWEV